MTRLSLGGSYSNKGESKGGIVGIGERWIALLLSRLLQEPGMGEAELVLRERPEVKGRRSALMSTIGGRDEE